MITEIAKKTSLGTSDLLTRFLGDCQARGLSPYTIKTYRAYLRHFAVENPIIPTDTKIVENWLSVRGESLDGGKRGNVCKMLQSFYDYLWRSNVIASSPIPPGKIGRPRKPLKPKRPRGRPRKTTNNADKVVEGGVRTFTVTFTGTITISPAAPTV